MCLCAGADSDSDVTLGYIPGAPTLAGTGRPDLQDLFNLPEPYCHPFRRMLAHPAVISRLNWMIGAVCPSYQFCYCTSRTAEQGGVVDLTNKSSVVGIPVLPEYSPLPYTGAAQKSRYEPMGSLLA
jgi:hypothetical protein